MWHRGVARRGARRARIRGASFTGLMVAVIVLAMPTACDKPTPVPPLAPSQLEHTPIAGVAGVVFTPTATPGDAATATAAATVVREPPEPLWVPAGFAVSVFAEGLGPVRSIRRAPNGDIFASVPAMDSLLILPDRDMDGVADGMAVYHSGHGLNHPAGIAFSEGHLWVANTDSVVRFGYVDGDLVATAFPELVFALAGGGRNPDRSLIIDRAGDLFVGVGAPCNACIAEDPRSATVLRFSIDGSSASLVARGLRDPGGMAHDPRWDRIWLTDKARDDRGDDGPPDELNRLITGGDFGWPACFGDRQPDVEFGGSAERCRETIPPHIKWPAHFAPTGLVFYEGEQFPEEQRDDLFVASRGSTLGSSPIGYKVVRVVFEDGEPTGEVFDTVRGWLRPDTRRWGRPVDVEMSQDGSLLVADEGGGRIYRVYYDPPTPTATPPF